MVAWLLTLAVLAVVAGVSCGGEQEGEQKRDETGEAHDTGHEIVGDPGAVVATVNAERITLAEVDLLATFWLQSRQPEARQTQTRADLQHEALDRLIEQLLLMDEATRLGFSVSDSLIDERLGVWEEQAQDNESVQERMRRSNVTPEIVREHLRRDAVIQQMVKEQIQDTLEISPAEIRAYYQEHPEHFDNLQVRASHILIGVEPSAPPESLAAARERTEQLLARLKAGEDFASLARAYSTGPSAPAGGDLGLAARGRWVKPFQEAAFALAPGEISDVVATQFGFHIIKVTERIDTEWTPLDQIEGAIKQYLFGAKMQRAVDAFAARLRADADVKVNIEPPQSPE
jgi:peptidyl-prolyl cis-trans isomerase C